MDINEYVKCDIYALTKDGAKTPINVSSISQYNVAGRITKGVNWEEGREVLYVIVENTGGTQISRAGCSVNYTYNGKKYSIGPTFTEADGNNFR